MAEKLEEENKNQKEKILGLEKKIENNVEILCSNCSECKKDVFNKFEL